LPRALERLPGSLDPAEDRSGGRDEEGRLLGPPVTAYEDEIWRQLPADRALDEPAARFALETLELAAASGERPAVLNLGCGDGKLAARLQRAGAAVTGVDRSTVALERARAEHPGLELAAPAPDGRL